jgi:DNA polymerase III subunit epsilon
MILFFDSETTNLPEWKLPSDDPCQPHLIQLAALLTDNDGNEVNRLSTIVKPGEGAVMGVEAFKAHGITLDHAREVGMPPVDAVRSFVEMARQADEIVGHNVSFDIRIMRIAAARHLGFKWQNTLPTFCTMKRSQAIVDLPPTEAMIRANRNWPKPPKLVECMEHFFGEGLDGAHDALVDVTACKRVYFHLKSMQAERVAA